MPVRQGRYTLYLPSQPGIIGYAAVVGKKEGEGPLAEKFLVKLSAGDDGLYAELHNHGFSIIVR